MFTFIHLSNEQKHDEWNIFLFFVRSFFPPAIGIVSACVSSDISNCEWRKKIEMCERENIRFQLSFANQRCFRWEMTKVKPLKALSIQRDSVYKKHRELFSGEEDFLLKLKSPSFVRQECLEVLGQDQFLLMPPLIFSRKPFCFEEKFRFVQDFPTPRL